MTVEAMSSLPFSAGSAVAAAAGRAALWGVAAYMRAPLRNTALAALIGLSAMAGSNALYHQAHRHPQPLFGSFAAAPAKASVTPRSTTPVMPVAKPKGLKQVISNETTGSVDADVSSKTIGTDDVAALQGQLKALQLFDGTVDGLFGPRTAKAIKAFEAKIGRTPRGLLTPQIVALVKATPLPAPLADQATPTADPATQVALSVNTTPQKSAVTPLALTENVNPLPAPAPLSVTAQEPEGNVQIATADASQSTVPLPAISDAPSVTKRMVSTIAVHAAAAPSEATTGDAATDDAASVDTAVTEQQMPSALDPAEVVPPITEGTDAATNPKVVEIVQRGLNRLGFLHSQISGIADEATAKAIRNFENYFNFEETGRVTTGLVRLLAEKGALT